MLKKNLFTTDQSNYAVQANTITGSNLNLFMELPEMIFVETRFIRQQDAVNLHSETTNLVDSFNKAKFEGLVPPTTSPSPAVNPSAVNPTTVNPPVLNPQLPVAAATTVSTNTQTIKNVPPILKKITIDCETITDSPNPLRDRGQQTEAIQKKTVSIGIQCSIDEVEQLQNDTFCATTLNDKHSLELIKERFKMFLDEHTQLLTNGKQECLICGEIAVNVNKLQAHMAFHWGPSVLCSRCGRELEHKVLLGRHDCENVPPKRKRKQHQLKCPHFRCRVTAISRLELYDHINEHTGFRAYRCRGCKRAFATYGELRHHLALRLECLEAAAHQRSPFKRFKNKQDMVYRRRVYRIFSSKKKHILVKTFLSTSLSTSRSNLRCQLCQKRFANFFQFGNHNKRCFKRFVRRLRRKNSRQTETPDSKLTNGH